jgi:5-hydroxyisourate hydrolase
MAGALTTHVLDTANGTAAAGLTITLYRLEGTTRTELGTYTTNQDGRTNTPLLAGETLLPGLYELIFAVGAWRKDTSSFYDDIPIRFRITNPTTHYHIPLILSPFSYATYRGS